MLEQNIPLHLATTLNIPLKKVEGAISLLDEDLSIPFIARYRKEVTGELKDEQLRQLKEDLTYFRNLVKRQEEIRKSITEQEKMTEEISSAIDKVTKLQDLEDLYLPFKQKKRTRASVAKEYGLEPLAEIIISQDKSIDLTIEAGKFLNDNVANEEDAINGALDIIAENISDDAAIRKILRKQMEESGILSITRDGEKDEDEIFLMYDNYEEKVKFIPSHRVLAINRGEKKDILKVKLVTNIEEDCNIIKKRLVKENSPYEEILDKTILDSYKRLIFPALEREIRNELTTVAEEKAINLFGKNLKQLLLQAPLTGYVVMGIDPGYRTGCKVAIVDATGNVLDHGVIYVTMGDKQRDKYKSVVLDFIKRYNVNLISIGNGTASYETECFIADLIKEYNLDVNYLITNEAGASVYSASKVGIEEFPDFDVTVRGAISIARRIQDPMAELVKIDPKSIGVGQYQHDVNQKELSKTLDAVVEDSVNHVGVELNTASSELLKHIAGINSTVAKNIVKYRNENGKFKSRKELLKVARLGQVAYLQCAGFLRILGGDNPFDNTSVHPESYEVTTAILEKYNFSIHDILDKNKREEIKAVFTKTNLEDLAKELAIGLPTLKDIVDSLLKPGRDPREDMPKPVTRKNIINLEDIEIGSIMTGTVRNITDFGAFVDIGIKTSGLIHIKNLAKKFVKHPLDVVSVGDVLKVKVIEVDAKRGRIALSLKDV